MNVYAKANLLFLIVFLSPAAHSQSAIIRAGHMIEPGSGQVLSNQTIVVRDGLIQQISSGVVNDPTLPVIDLSESWVLPGLIDAHVHITWNVDDFGSPKWDAVVVRESTALRALRGAKVASEFLEAGFTTLKEIGNDANYASSDVIKAIEMGWFRGPDIQYSGKIIAPYGGQDSGVSYRNRGYWDFEYTDADTRDEMIKAIRQNIYFGADTIKLVSDEFSYSYSEEDIRFMVREAAKSGLKVTVHVMGGVPARNAIIGGAAGIEHGFDLDEELLRLMKEEGTYLIGTDFSYENFLAYGESTEEAKENEQKIVARLRLAYELGVKIAYGSDIVINLPDRNRVDSSLEVLKSWKKAEIPSMDVLRAMTANAADLMGLGETHGHLKTGYVANLVAMRSSPLEDIENIKTVHFVMKDGAVIRED